MYEDLFYRRLTTLRNQMDVSAREMSLDLGQSASYINAIENQKSLPSMQVFFYICEYLKVSPSEFFDETNPCPQELRKIVDILKELTPEQLSHLEYIAGQMRRKT